MSMSITFRCGGCDAVAEARVPPVEFLPGNRAGWVQVKKPTIESTVPDGWTAFDPYTFLTYCSECWASIETPDDALAKEG